MHATSNARAMIVQYWIGIPNRVNSLAKNSTNSSISQSYITLLITAIPWHSSLKDEGRLSWRPLSFQAKRAMSACGTSRTFAAPQHFVRYWTRADIGKVTALHLLRPVPLHLFTRNALGRANRVEQPS